MWAGYPLWQVASQFPISLVSGYDRWVNLTSDIFGNLSFSHLLSATQRPYHQPKLVVLLRFGVETSGCRLLGTVTWYCLLFCFFYIVNGGVYMDLSVEVG